jgi:predicted nucleic acid-binding Zn ribbon protein
MTVTTSNVFDVRIPDQRVQTSRIESDRIVATYKGWPEPQELERGKVLHVELDLHRPPDPPAQAHLREIASHIQIPKRAISMDALSEFLSARAPDQIAAFVQKYGEFKRTWPFRSKREFSVSIPHFVAEQEYLRDILRVWSELKRGDKKKSQSIAKTMGLANLGDLQVSISAALTYRLQSDAEILLVTESGSLRAVLFCHDVLTGLYGLLFAAVAFDEPWATCPRCSKPFQVERRGKRFCSEKCQQADKQRRYREASHKGRKRR